MLKVEAIKIFKWKDKSQIWKMEHLFFPPCHKIIYILIELWRRSCLKPVKRHMKYIFPIVQKKVINDEPKSHTQEFYFLWIWRTFLKSDSEEWVSFKMSGRESNITWLLQPKGPGRETSLLESEVGLRIEYEENAGKQ